MKYTLSLTLIALLFYSCKDTLNDKDKRNENWVWWIDAKTGKSSWIPVKDDGPAVMNGKYISFYLNGNICQKGKLIDGKEADTTFCYDIKGQPEEYIINKGDTIEYFYHNGPIKTLYEDGTLSAEGVVENHKYGGKWVNYYKNGKPKYIRNLNRDTGWITSYYDNGKVKDSDYFEGKHGLHIKHWYVTGQLAESNEFKNGDFNGLQKEYYFNGGLKSVINVINGKSNGEEKLWYEDGKPHAIIHKKNNLYDGRQTVYYENGRVQFEVTAKEGKGDGEVRKYDENGKLTDDYFLKDGIRVTDALNALLKH